MQRAAFVQQCDGISRSSRQIKPPAERVLAMTPRNLLLARPLEGENGKYMGVGTGGGASHITGAEQRGCAGAQRKSSGWSCDH